MYLMEAKMGEASILLTEKKEEAIRRMQAICDKYEIGNKLVEYLKEGRVYYSYVYSMDVINYNERYANIVRAFEEEHNAYVYHAVEAFDPDCGTLLSLLYVSDIREDWKQELLGKSGYITTDTFALGYGDEEIFEEMGDIWIAAPFGYLARTDLTNGDF